MQRLDTLKITHPTRGFAIINATAFDPERHTLFQEATGATETPVDAGEGLTREDVMAMSKAALLELLQAHGVSAPSRAPVDVLRRNALEILFVDL